VAFTALNLPTIGLGIDGSTALLIEPTHGEPTHGEPTQGDWLWTIYGKGCAYLVEPSHTLFRDRRDERLSSDFGRIHLIRVANGCSQRFSSLRQSMPSHRLFFSKNTLFSPDNQGNLYGFRARKHE